MSTNPTLKPQRGLFFQRHELFSFFLLAVELGVLSENTKSTLIHDFNSTGKFRFNFTKTLNILNGRLANNTIHIKLDTGEELTMEHLKALQTAIERGDMILASLR